MGKGIRVALILIISWTTSFASDFVFEAATGLGSPYSPFSSKWNGSVGSSGLLFKEYAFRGSYQLHNRIMIAGSIGWLKNGKVKDRIIFSPDVPPIPPFGYNRMEALQEVTYFVPSILLTLEAVRLDLGSIIYSESRSDDNAQEFGYPFDGGHKFRPVMGLEFGEQSGFLFFRFLDTFPLYAGGVSEVGIGGRVGGIYEHKGYLFFTPFDGIGLGYRGEFRIYRRTAISVGASFGGNETDNVFLLSLGLKTII
jgi:hypothetical protein